MARIKYRGLIYASIPAILVRLNILSSLAISGVAGRQSSFVRTSTNSRVSTSSITANSRSRRVKNDPSQLKQQHQQQQQNRINEEKLQSSLRKSSSSSSSSRRSFGEMLMETARPYREFKAELEASGGRILDSNDVQNPASRRDTLPEFMKIEVTNSDQGDSRQHRRRLDDYAYNDDDADDDDAADDDAEDDADDDDAEDEEKGYEYYLDSSSTVDFSGYSFVYAQCQPIQRFSEQAALGGEYSPLVTDEIVLFRFCPQRRCNVDAANGCLSGYGEYVVSLTNYLRAKLYYEYDKRANVCEFCKKCGYRRRMKEEEERERQRRRRLGDDYYAADDGDDANDGGGDDGGGNDDRDDYYAADDDDDDYGGDDADDDDSDVKLCSTYADVCSDYSYECDAWNNRNDDEESGDGGEDDGSSYMDYLDYLDHLECQQSENNKNGGAYYLKPHCDIYKDSIYMGAYMDPYCSQYAGSDVRVSDYLDGSFQKDIFQDLNAKECIKCAQNNYPPFYNANSNFCNRLYADSGHCNTYLAYSLDDDDDDGGGSSSSSSTASTCSFAESVRYGTYDKDGQIAIYSARSNGGSGTAQPGEITSGQVVSLVFLTLIITGLSLYSCYLHHSITNFLLTKLTYQGALLPTNMKIRHSKRSHKSSTASGMTGGGDDKSRRSRASKRSHAEERVGPIED